MGWGGGWGGRGGGCGRRTDGRAAQETRIRATEQEARGKLHSVTVTNRYGAEEVTHTLLAESRAETQRWMEAFWQHFYDMSAWGRGSTAPPAAPSRTPPRPAPPPAVRGSAAVPSRPAPSPRARRSMEAVL